jgi:hypothetical protein
VFLVVCLRVFLGRLSHPYFKKLKREFRIMVGCSICRIVIDSIYLIFSLSGDSSRERWCVSEENY